MSIPAEYTASISTIPYRYDPGVRRDCGISYFVDNQLHQGILSIQDSGTADHQGLGISDANTGVGSKYSGDVLS